MQNLALRPWIWLVLLWPSARLWVPTASRGGRGSYFGSRVLRRVPASASMQDLPSQGDGSGQVVSKILEAGVRLLLRRYDLVSVSVASRWDQLMRGRVEAVKLFGKNWCTKLQLRARQLTVTTHCAALDYGELLQGRVTLTEVAKGFAEAIFDAEEFGDFLLYPQVAQAAPVVLGSRFRFMEQKVKIDFETKTVFFQGRHPGDFFQARLTCSDKGARPKVSLHSETASKATTGELERALSAFFATLYIDLAGGDPTDSQSLPGPDLRSLCSERDPD
ncbi:Zeta-carotene-forming phytoene desaturase [Durusdinium trenchii]|uniref:Zeta-carotene-forming phytoene desaturase n=1 Tax=Durusdinium trenchii TaxID=1381693 RepID=A0ABP0R6E9_9DINO